MSTRDALACLVDLWDERDERYRHRLSLSPEQQVLIRAERRREALALPEDQRLGALELVDDWTPPLTRRRPVPALQRVG